MCDRVAWGSRGMCGRTLFLICSLIPGILFRRCVLLPFSAVQEHQKVEKDSRRQYHKMTQLQGSRGDDGRLSLALGVSVFGNIVLGVLWLRLQPEERAEQQVCGAVQGQRRGEALAGGEGGEGGGREGGECEALQETARSSCSSSGNSSFSFEPASMAAAARVAPGRLSSSATVGGGSCFQRNCL